MNCRFLDYKMVNEVLIEKIRKFVEEECKKPDANYSNAYKFHFISMHKIAKELAEKFSADVEVVEIAAWLHDIGAIVDGRENHHITGALIAEEKLRKLNYSEKNIEKVKECILNHRGSKEGENKRLSIESKIIAEADVLDAFDNIAKQFLVTLVYEKKSLEDAKISVLNKLKNKWNQLEFEGSKELIRSKFEAVILLFGD
ncbi:HD domain-containing protein [Candidatus Pacearchaeota archaeon]|nr:HD domain-containing protein [Candidatus Pacearchaeota archaeon]